MTKKKKEKSTLPETALEATETELQDKSKEIEAAALPVKTTATDFPIVAIGASAGGLEALELFFKNMPKDSGIAFVVIQHLDPTHIGIMPELLQRTTQMKVFQASDSAKVKPNCLYVIPPNKSMSILNGALLLFEPVESRGLRLPIDIFFRSLAEDRQDKSIGIILSGMGSDGSLGLKAIKEKNGFVLVQDPISAKFDGMPCSAIQSVIADIVAPPEKLPAKLIDLLKYVPEITDATEVLDKDKNSLEKVIFLLREQTGHDFSSYKKNTLLRRIERRKSIHQIDKMHQYVWFLQENPKEVTLLFKELLIGVTNFFRDTPVWELLKEKVFPKLIEELHDGYVLRAWVPACSTGEEAFSLAITFKESLDKIKPHKNITIQIFATDIDAEAIEKARRGIFTKNITADVSPERLQRFFTSIDNGYCVSSTIREMVVFAVQNVIKDPPFTRLEILTCRNMLIYMEHDLQKKIIALFNYSLNPGGIMILGTSETIGANTAGFDEIDTKLKIFKRSLSNPQPELIDFPSSFYINKKRSPLIKEEPKVVENIQTIVDTIILQQFTPASVLVNSKGDIIYITGKTGKYLEPVAGKANWNIHVMAREGLREILPGALRFAMESLEPVKHQNIKIHTDFGEQLVDVAFQRVVAPGTAKNMVMVVFTDVSLSIKSGRKSVKKGEQAVLDIQREMGIKLQRSHEDNQSIREEMQTSQEELKSTNEELQSTNEELQSTNEELTTSKEEMQSLNEELQTVNLELLSKVNDFIRANDDMKNLLNSTEIATLFLDKELNIRRFTDKVTNIFKLRSGDIGRPFTDQVSDLLYPEIANNAREVMKTLISVETEITTNDNRWFSVRIMPYRTLDDRIDGLVITFSDITKAKMLENQLKEANKEFRNKN